MAIALVLIDVQQGFRECGPGSYWGPRNNPEAEANMVALARHWGERGEPVVLVRHDSAEPDSPLRPDRPGNRLIPELDEVRPALAFGKRVNSAFHGEVDLDRWLRGRGIDGVVLAGIQTNMCVETTARVGGNLGYRVTVALDATHTFDLAGPDREVLTADELSRATATNLHGGGFATVTSTATILAAHG